LVGRNIERLETLKILQQHIPLETNEVPAGTEVFNWSISKEWNIMEKGLENY